jgi:dihydroorotate dehydrogenase (NAD+) catalytic subunit
MGGISSGRDAREFLDAGATCVAVGTESFRDPSAGRRVASELGVISRQERGFSIATSPR